MDDQQQSPSTSIDLSGLWGSDFLTEEQLLDHLGWHPKKLQRLRESGKGPPRITVGYTYFYRKSSFLLWLASLEEAGIRTRQRRKVR